MKKKHAFSPLHNNASEERLCYLIQGRTRMDQNAWLNADLQIYFRLMCD